MLRDRDDRGLVGLLLDRPDLAFPAPTDVAELAARATTRSSVEAALGLLDRVELWAAAATASGAGDVDDLVAAGLAEADAVRALTRLVDLALVWGDADSRSDLRPVRALVAVLGQGPPGPPPAVTPPEPWTATRRMDSVDAAAAGSAFSFVRRLDVLLEHCEHAPPRLLRDGGLAVRERRSLAASLDVGSPVADTYLELARQAKLLGLAAYAGAEVLAPTAAYDDWRTLPLADQWAVVVEAWLAAPRQPRDLAELVLRAFGDPADGRVVEADGLLTWLDWQRPRRPASADRAARTLLEQAAEIGMTGLGALASFAATLDVRALDPLLPRRGDQVLVQADLTAVAPGPLTAQAAEDLGALADVESRGGATVYRLGAESLARARGLGWTAEEILDTLRRRSRTPLPQALEYLVRDLDRQPLAAETSGSGHRPGLRGTAMGDSASGPADRLDETAAVAIVAGLRCSPKPQSRPDVAPPAEPLHATPLPVLREAAETGEPVWLGFVDPLGRAGERLLHVSEVADGRVRGTELRHGAPFAVAVHRVTAAHIIRAASDSA